MVLLALALAIAPGLFWLWFYYKRDKFDPEPKSLIAKTFFMGIVICFPVIILELPFPGAFLGAVIAAPLFEELFKYFAVRWVAFKHSAFNEPFDGIIYSAAAALGFATIENVFYVVGTYLREGAAAMTTVVIMRAVLSVPGHTLFSGFWGYALGKAKFMPAQDGKGLIVRGLLLAMASHAAFNFMLVVSPYLAIIVIGLVIFLWVIMMRRIKEMLKESPFNPDNIVQSADGLEKQCTRCGTVNIPNAKFCEHCGTTFVTVTQTDTPSQRAQRSFGTIRTPLYIYSFVGCLTAGLLFFIIGFSMVKTSESVTTPTEQTSTSSDTMPDTSDLGDSLSNLFTQARNGLAEKPTVSETSESEAKVIKVDELAQDEMMNESDTDTTTSSNVTEDTGEAKTIHGIEKNPEHVSGSRGGEFLLLGFLMIAAAMGIHYTFTYKVWTNVSSFCSRANPFTSIAFQWIPLYNLYWYFQIYHGMAEDFNHYTAQNQKNIPVVNTGLAMSVSVLMCAMAIPVVNFFAAIPFVIVYALYMNNIGNAVNALNDANA